MIGLPPPNRDRFLAAIAERVSPDRVQAVFLFAAIKQGPVETGVAVLAVDPMPAPVSDVATAIEAGAGAVSTAEQGAADEIAHNLNPAELIASELIPEAIVPAEMIADELAAEKIADDEVEAAALDEPLTVRPVVLTARYRHTLKGPDRGKWELEILEQADAPMITIEKVIRGVQQRLDDASEPERLGADALRKALAEGVWTTPNR